MRILMITPPSGGIDVYVGALSEQLARLGHEVSIRGSSPEFKAFDAVNKSWRTSVEVKEYVNQLARDIPFTDFDLVAFHYGKNDIEQYLPTAIKQQRISHPPQVYFVHFLSRNLFSQYLGDEAAQQEVESNTATCFDGYVFFGNYAKNFMEERYKKALPGTVSFLPETHSQDHTTKAQTAEILKTYRFRNDVPTIFFTGYAANYKDHELLLKSFEYVHEPVNFVFAGPGWRKRLGAEHLQIHRVNVNVVDQHISSKEYKVLAQNSLFGVFPYRQPPAGDEYFQGSGTLPNFIFAGKACVVLEDGAMSEYLGNAGIVCRVGDAKDFGEAVNRLLKDDTRKKYERQARDRSRLFSIEEHAKACDSYFRSLIKPAQV